VPPDDGRVDARGEAGRVGQDDQPALVDLAVGGGDDVRMAAVVLVEQVGNPCRRGERVVRRVLAEDQPPTTASKVITAG
jgi:hypothetical protein